MCSQVNPNLKEIGSSQTKHCINNAYRKKSKEAQIMNRTMNNKMNKIGK